MKSIDVIKSRGTVCVWWATRVSKLGAHIHHWFEIDIMAKHWRKQSQPHFNGIHQLPWNSPWMKKSEESSCEQSRYSTPPAKRYKKKRKKSVSKFTFYTLLTRPVKGFRKALFRRKHGLLGWPICQFPLKSDPDNSTKESLVSISGTFSTPRCRVTW